MADKHSIFDLGFLDWNAADFFGTFDFSAAVQDGGQQSNASPAAEESQSEIQSVARAFQTDDAASLIADLIPGSLHESGGNAGSLAELVKDAGSSDSGALTGAFQTQSFMPSGFGNSAQHNSSAFEPFSEIASGALFGGLDLGSILKTADSASSTLGGGSSSDQSDSVATDDDGTFTYPASLGGSFAPNTHDTIADFEDGNKIDVSAIDANLTAAGSQSFVEDTDGNLTAGEYRITVDGNDTVITFNTDGDATVELQITVKGVTDITPDDLIL